VSIEDLASGRIDFALGYSEGSDRLPSGVETLDWLTDHYLVIASRDHPRVRNQLDLAGYLHERHVVVTPWNETSGAIDHVLDGMGLQREVAVQLPTVMAAPFIVGATELLMTVPGHAARTLQQVAGVELYPAPFEIPPYALRLYSHAKYARSDAHAWMLEQLRALREG
jgi:DNA-binding transcriptional LysR family regulator